VHTAYSKVKFFSLKRFGRAVDTTDSGNVFRYKNRTRVCRLVLLGLDMTVSISALGGGVGCHLQADRGSASCEKLWATR
jgi:hypothetical protein